MTPTISVQKDESGVTTITFTVYERPWTTNAERKGNRWDRASKTSQWREMFGWLGKSQRLPCLTQVYVTVNLTLKGRLQDTGACHPAVKAAIDGLVDANVMPDDTPEHMVGMFFVSPTRDTFDRITISLSGIPVEQPA